MIASIVDRKESRKTLRDSSAFLGMLCYIAPESLLAVCLSHEPWRTLLIGVMRGALVKGTHITRGLRGMADRVPIIELTKPRNGRCQLATTHCQRQGAHNYCHDQQWL